METIQVELKEHDLVCAFHKAKDQAYQIWYRKGMTVTLLSMSMLVDEDGHTYLYTFQVVRD